jgi:alpha-D-ribose 1-methylphosphonate 5-triphosphate synthase subunit PhnH
MPLPAPGFADPVAQSQVAFRALLDAIARPGKIVELPAPDGMPDGISVAQAAIALALADADAPVWLAGAATAARPWIAFHTGAPQAATPAEARFAFADGPAALPPLGAFALGSDAYPDRSTTLVIEMPGLTAGGPLTLSGPGIQGVARATIALPDAFWAARAGLAEVFPRGIDLFLTDGARVLGLPRTTIVERN